MHKFSYFHFISLLTHLDMKRNINPVTLISKKDLVKIVQTIFIVKFHAAFYSLQLYLKGTFPTHFFSGNFQSTVLLSKCYENNIRGGPRPAATSKMEHIVIIVNGLQRSYIRLWTFNFIETRPYHGRSPKNVPTSCWSSNFTGQFWVAACKKCVFASLFE